MTNELNQSNAQRDELNQLIAERNQRMRQIEKLYEEIRAIDQQVVVLRKGGGAVDADKGAPAPLQQRPGEAA